MRTWWISKQEIHCLEVSTFADNTMYRGISTTSAFLVRFAANTIRNPSGQFGMSLFISRTMMKNPSGQFGMSPCMFLVLFRHPRTRWRIVLSSLECRHAQFLIIKTNIPIQHTGRHAYSFNVDQSSIQTLRPDKNCNQRRPRQLPKRHPTLRTVLPKETLKHDVDSCKCLSETDDC